MPSNHVIDTNVYGVEYCMMCGCTGTMTTECPNEPIGEDKQARINSGELDYDTDTRAKKTCWWKLTKDNE